MLNLPSADLAGAVDRLALLTGSPELSLYKIEKGYRYEPDKFGAAGLYCVAGQPGRGAARGRVPHSARMRAAAAAPFGTGTRATAHTVRVLRAHVEEQLIVPGTQHVDPLGWQPLIMKFCEFFGDGAQVHTSRLARAWDIPQPVPAG